MAPRTGTLVALALAVVAAACGDGAGSSAAPRGGGAGGHDAGSGGGAIDSGTVPPGPGADAAADSGVSGPDVTPGAPITAPDGVWTEVDFPQGYCRDGSQAHLMVHLNSASQKVAIYEEGGGACFNDASCTLLTIDLPSYVLGQGIFNFSNADNPIRDWNIFYVPYCTGDVHAGNNAAGDPGSLTGSTHYAGYTNLKLYLSRILATVPGATDWLLTGSSAGGFGAGLTADLVARNVPSSVQRLTMIDDSGPPMRTEFIPSCLQQQWSSVWGFGNSVLADCGPACPDPTNYIGSWMEFLVSKYARGPNAGRFMAGLISSTSDAVISTFFGFGASDCTSPVPIPLSGSQFQAGLLDVRAWAQGATSRFGTFYYDSSAHTTLITDTGIQIQSTPLGLIGGLYGTEANGVKLTDWIRDLLDHKQAAHVGP
jgi:Pectinacetylesterase